MDIAVEPLNRAVTQRRGSAGEVDEARHLVQRLGDVRQGKAHQCVLANGDAVAGVQALRQVGP